MWRGPWLITGPLSLMPLTVWLLAGLQQPHRWARVRPAMHPKVFLCQMPFLPQPSLFLGRICSLSYPQKLLNVINNSRLTALPFVKIVMHTVKTCVYSYKQGRIMAYNIEGTYERWLHSILNMYVSQSITMVLCIASTELSILHWNINLAIWFNDLIWIHKEIIVITIDIAWFSSVFQAPLCLRSSWCCVLNFFCLHPSLYLLVSWAWWDWPLTWLTN